MLVVVESAPVADAIRLVRMSPEGVRPCLGHAVGGMHGAGRGAEPTKPGATKRDEPRRTDEGSVGNGVRDQVGLGDATEVLVAENGLDEGRRVVEPAVADAVVAVRRVEARLPGATEVARVAADGVDPHDRGAGRELDDRERAAREVGWREPPGRATAAHARGMRRAAGAS